VQWRFDKEKGCVRRTSQDIETSIPTAMFKPVFTMTEAVLENTGGVPSKSMIVSPITSLGQVFMQAAILAEAMSSYSDEELIRVHLMADPPLHPRRTLDESDGVLGSRSSEIARLCTGRQQ
jgi:hypothetical protein